MKKNSQTLDKRSKKPGRREEDKHCPFYPLNCRDILVTKEEFITMRDCLNDLKASKLSSWIFKLFVSTIIPVSIIILGWVGYSTYKNLEVTTRLETNQIHIMEHWNLPVAEKKKEVKK